MLFVLYLPTDGIVRMPYYRSGVCACPKCRKHLFDGPSVAEDNTKISCRACKHVTTIEEAEAFGKETSLARATFREFRGCLCKHETVIIGEMMLRSPMQGQLALSTTNLAPIAKN